LCSSLLSEDENKKCSRCNKQVLIKLYQDHSLRCKAGCFNPVVSKRSDAVNRCVMKIARDAGVQMVQYEPMVVRRLNSSATAYSRKGNRADLEISSLNWKSGNLGGVQKKTYVIDFVITHSGMKVGDQDLGDSQKQMMEYSKKKNNKYNTEVDAQGKVFVPAVATALGLMGPGLLSILRKLTDAAAENGMENPVNHNFYRKLAFIFAGTLSTLYIETLGISSFRGLPGRKRHEPVQEYVDRRICG
jgi:hypothetical protein